MRRGTGVPLPQRGTKMALPRRISCRAPSLGRAGPRAGPALHSGQFPSRRRTGSCIFPVNITPLIAGNRCRSSHSQSPTRGSQYGLADYLPSERGLRAGLVAPGTVCLLWAFAGRHISPGHGRTRVVSTNVNAACARSGVPRERCRPSLVLLGERTEAERMENGSSPLHIQAGLS
jgi:hypothetical protein